MVGSWKMILVLIIRQVESLLVKALINASLPALMEHA